MQVNIFKSITSHHSELISIDDALYSFCNDTYKDQITKLRDVYLKDNKIYNEMKRNLPAITFCGQFENGHKAENLIEYHKIMVIDVDKIFDEEFIRVHNCLCNNPFTFAVWTSPSGAGIKALIRLEYESEHNISEWGNIHKLAFKEIASYFAREENIIIDKSGSDICRLCFVSYDKDLITKDASAYYISTTSILGNEEKNEIYKNILLTKNNLSNINSHTKTSYHHLQRGQKNKSIHRNEISRIIRFLKKNSKSITTSYEDWYRVGYAIASTFTFEIGIKYYMTLCELDGIKHDAIASENMLIYCYENMKNKITFATILYLAEIQGYIRGSSKGNISYKCESDQCPCS